jgi:uncharacterized protein (DUF1778 family)
MGKHDYSNEKSREVHFRLYGHEAKIVSDELKTIERACQFLGLTISEFCRMASIKEARKVLLDYRKDKIMFAKKILLDEESRLKREELLGEK